MTRDEAVFPNPEEFNPERYLEEDLDEVTAKARDPRNYVFGFGRRRCPGQWMIDSSLWIAIASMLASFDIRKAVDEFGNVIEPEVVYDNSVFTCVYSPLPCSSSPLRSRARWTCSELCLCASVWCACTRARSVGGACQGGVWGGMAVLTVR